MKSFGYSLTISFLRLCFIRDASPASIVSKLFRKQQRTVVNFGIKFRLCVFHRFSGDRDTVQQCLTQIDRVNKSMGNE
jgi:hypothetical protein